MRKNKLLRALSIGIIVTGVGAIGTGFYQLDKQIDTHKAEVKKLEVSNTGLKDEIFDKNIQLEKQQAEIKDQKEKALEKAKNDQARISNLEKQNDDLKKKIEYYKNRSESPSVSSLPSRGKETGRTLRVKATAYHALCDSGCTGITATGINVRSNIHHNGKRVIAVDPKVIPLHSVVKVETANDSFYAIAEDTGGAIDGYEIDVLVRNNARAENFGNQMATVTVLREGR